jgi:signal transduction histidine kinase
MGTILKGCIMEFFATNEEVSALEQALSATPATPSQARLDCMLALCWHLRQRDSARALQLADELETLLADSAMPEPAAQAILLRVKLVRGEIHWLFGEIDAGEAMAQAALHGFEQLAEPIGCADAHWLQTSLAYYHSDIERLDTALSSMARKVQKHDPVRGVIAQAAMASDSAFRDLTAAKAHWSLRLASRNTPRHPAGRCWVEYFWGVIAFLSSDYLLAIRHWSQSHMLANQTGQIRWAIMTATNVADAFNHLNDYHTALEWLQRALTLARSKGWPGVISLALMYTAETQRRLKHFDVAHQLLRETLAMLTPLASSRVYGIALQGLGNVELVREQYSAALNTFQKLEQHARGIKHGDLQCAARRGQAQALLQLGQAKAALQIAQAALDASGNSINDQIAALRVVAEIHSHHSLPHPPGMRSASPALHYLEQAFALAARIESYTMPGEVLDFIALEYAHVGDHIHAFEYARQASMAREKIYSLEATNRAMALQVSQAAEKAQLEIEQHQQLALAETRRAEVLQQTSVTLTHLGAIGQEITACLDARRIFQILEQHVHHLLDVTSFGIFLPCADGQAVELAFGFEAGQPLPYIRIQLDQADSEHARCARERCEILVLLDPAETGQPAIAGTCFNRSRMFAPLHLDEQRASGLMGFQTTTAYAYGEREQLICRTLSAYTAIALANADAHGKLSAAHRQLQETQQQMVLQDKMAGLGTLTAGVAHEINNPTNFVHVAAQNQRIDLAEFEQFVTDLVEQDAGEEILQAFRQRFARLADNVNTMLNGTGRIKGIVRDLRAFTRLDEAEKKAVCLADCLRSTLNLVRASWIDKVEFITELQDDSILECWPALLNQVFMNLLVNACQAIDEKIRHDGPGSRGKLWLRLLREGDFWLIEIEDNGVGIDEARQARIMEPFYTTKEVGSGTGLGLSIAFGIVQKHGGSLEFASTLGVGSCFSIRLPLVATDKLQNNEIMATGRPAK